MKKTVLAFSILVVLLLSPLAMGTSLGQPQASQPVKDARPTPVPDRLLPSQQVPASPEIPPYPDLIVTNIELEPAQPYLGQEVTIRVTIANASQWNLTPGNNFWSDLYVDPAVVPIQLGQDGVAEWPCQSWWVPAGGSYVLETTYIFDDVKVYALYAQVDTDGHVTESNENNNVFGPVHVQVLASHQVVHQSHEDFQMGLASSLDISHPEGVIHPGIFDEPYEESPTAPSVYRPDVQVDHPPSPPSHPNNVNQVKPALASDGKGHLYAVWEDGRNGGVYNRDIYFSWSDDGGQHWKPDVRVNDDPALPATANQVSPDIAFDGGDTRIAVGGAFTQVSGEPRQRLAWIDPSGRLDPVFNPGAIGDADVYALAVQADGKIMVGGAFTQLGGQPRNNIGRINPDGTLDGGFNPGANGPVYALAVQPDGKIVVGGAFTQLGGQPRNNIGRLNPDGSLDTAFNPNANDTVYALAVQPDGKIVVGGEFTQLGGQPRNNIGRLNPDGSLDTSFDPQADGTVYALAVQPDGKIVVGGEFTQLGGQPRNNIGRINPDGTLDGGFNPGASGAVYALAVQADGKIVVGGAFIEMTGQPRERIVRLNPDGTLDGGFNPGANGPVYALAVQADGKIVMGGAFTQLGGQPRNRIGRINPNGTLDAGFNPGASGPVYALAVQADGKIVMGGAFTQLGGQPRNNIGRINPDGTLDGGFNPGANGTGYAAVYALAVQADGKIVVGGEFTQLGGQPRNNIGRINPDGTLDGGFNPGADGPVYALAVQEDGKIVVGGAFTQLGGRPRNNIGRLNPDGSLDTSFDPQADGTVYALAVQPDGKIMVGGAFTQMTGQPRLRIVRLNPDGSIDTGFGGDDPAYYPKANGDIYALALQSDGSIVVGGAFTKLCGEPRHYIGRLTPGGSLDHVFTPEANGTVYALAVQKGDKVLMGGAFTTVGGQPHGRIARLYPNGTVEADFNAQANGNVYALLIQPDWEIVIGGAFTQVDGQTRQHIARLNPDGSVDAFFDPRANDTVYALAWHTTAYVMGRLYVVWQDARSPSGDYDIYLAFTDVTATGPGSSWTNVKINDDVGTANQMNPSIAVGLPPADFACDESSEPRYAFDCIGKCVYVAWQDQRNGNDDIYLALSKDGGAHWGSNYFVTDDPDMTWQNQVAPSVGVDGRGNVVVAWEDWRDPLHPEIYAMMSEDAGKTFGLDVPVTIVAPEERRTYRTAPTIRVPAGPEYESVTVIHAAWQEGREEDSDIFYSYAVYEWCGGVPSCRWPYKFCFKPPEKISGFVKDMAYVRPPDEPASEQWPIEPSWQGQVTMSLVPYGAHPTSCHDDPRNPSRYPPDGYSGGVILAWSDARSFDEWRYEIRTRRVASPGGNPAVYEVCDGDWAEGVVNDNAKLIAYRDDPDLYQTFKPAATRQHNPSVAVDRTGVYLVWDDDRWDRPVEPGTVRDRDIFYAQMRTPDWRVFPPAEAFPADDRGIYISPVIDSRASDARWYVLTWWGATEFYGDLLFQTRFGNTPNPPQENAAIGTWTKWTGNPSSTYLGCTAGEGCYYDAPGRHIVDPAGKEWFDCPGPNCPGNYRYMQYKVIMKTTDPDYVLSRTTAVSQVKIYYRGPYTVYLPVAYRNYY